MRWKLAIEKYIVEQGYIIGTLVAFSGEVDDPDTPGGPFTEAGALMNPLLKGRDIREAFKGDGYQLLLVANKFQTGFDQPLLCGMYVDKRLAGIQAVQTLSRLNRAYPGKDTTYVLDFVNDPQEVLAAFQTYYTTATLETTTDPNLVFDLRAKLDGAGAYDDHEVERVVKVALNPKATQQELSAAIEPVANRLMVRYRNAQQAHRQAEALGDATAMQAAKESMEALVLFKADLGTYIRLYTFLAQIFDYGNTALEKRAIFYKALGRLLDFGREREGIDLSKVQLTHHALKARGKSNLVLGEDGGTKLSPITEAGGGKVQEKERARLREIIAKVNTLFEGDLTDEDKLTYVNEVIKRKLMESAVLREQATHNTRQQFGNSPDLEAELLQAIIAALDAHTMMSTQALNSEGVRRGLKDILLNHAGLYDSLRDATGHPEAPPALDFHAWYHDLIGRPFPVEVAPEETKHLVAQTFGSDFLRLADLRNGDHHDEQFPFALNAVVSRQYRLFGHDGHGVNSYAFYETIVRDGLDIRLRLPLGGVYMDNDAAAADVHEVLRAVEQLVSAHDPSKGRLVVRMDMGVTKGTWTPVGGSPIDLNAIEDGSIGQWFTHLAARMLGMGRDDDRPSSHPS